MVTLLHVIGWILFVLTGLVGLSLNFLGLFGNWIILGDVVILGFVSKFHYFGGWFLTTLVVLAALGEGIELVASAVGTRQFGGSTGSMVAALIGGLVGAIFGSLFFPIIGTLLGALIGCFALATVWEFRQQHDWNRALCSGLGATVGRLGGTAAKVVIGLAMLLATGYKIIF